jgi:hypothetical protein
MAKVSKMAPEDAPKISRKKSARKFWWLSCDSIKGKKARNVPLSRDKFQRTTALSSLPQ